MQIRPAKPDDAEFVVGLTPRFVGFGMPAQRDAGTVQAETARDVREAVNGGGAVFVAEDEHGPLGFVHLQARPDLAGGERGHVSDLAVDARAEGRGVATALLRHAETWAADRGFARLGLSALVTNERAIGLYEHVGFERETITFTKRLAR